MRKNKVGRHFTTGCGMVGKASGRWLTGVNCKGLERVVLRGSVNHGFTAGWAVAILLEWCSYVHNVNKIDSVSGFFPVIKSLFHYLISSSCQLLWSLTFWWPLLIIEPENHFYLVISQKEITLYPSNLEHECIWPWYLICWFKVKGQRSRSAYDLDLWPQNLEFWNIFKKCRIAINAGWSNFFSSISTSIRHYGKVKRFFNFWFFCLKNPIFRHFWAIFCYSQPILTKKSTIN